MRVAASLLTFFLAAACDADRGGQSENVAIERDLEKYLNYVGTCITVGPSTKKEVLEELARLGFLVEGPDGFEVTPYGETQVRPYLHPLEEPPLLPAAPAFCYAHVSVEFLEFDDRLPEMVRYEVTPVTVRSWALESPVLRRHDPFLRDLAEGEPIVGALLVSRDGKGTWKVVPRPIPSGVWAPLAEAKP